MRHLGGPVGIPGLPARPRSASRRRGRGTTPAGSGSSGTGQLVRSRSEGASPRLSRTGLEVHEMLMSHKITEGEGAEGSLDVEAGGVDETWQVLCKPCVS